MANPTQNAVHVDSALTNFSVAYRQSADAFVADKLFPNIPVRFKSDEYYVYNRADFNRDEVALRAPATESAGGDYKLSTQTYTAAVKAFHKDVADQDRDNADPAIDLERDAVEFVMRKMMLNKERDFAEKFFTSGKWGFEKTGVAAGPTGNQFLKWSDDNSPIIDIIEEAIIEMESITGYAPNKMMVNRRAMTALKNHPEIVDRVKYATSTSDNPARVTPRTIAALFGLDEILMSTAVINSAPQGATEASDYVTGDNALLVHAPAAPSLMSPMAGATFSWTGYLNNGNAMGIATSRFRMDHLKAERIEAEMAYTQEIVAPDLGYFLGSVV